jgi:sorbitol/mannitol transport system substrate-binding protein
MRVTRLLSLALAACAITGASAWADTNLTIAMVNNNDLIVMQKLAREYLKDNPTVHLNWVVLEENVLRQRLTADIATNAGQFDIMTIGLFETPMWGKQGELVPFTDIPASYDINDVFKSVRDELSAGGKLYALPFYGESQMTFYRKDLFDKAGLTMPEKPTWDQVAGFAKTLHDPAHGVYGICLRGKAGWGENMGQVGPMMNGFGGRWFDMDWKPQLTTQPWKEAVSFYVNLLRQYGPPGASSNGYNETLALMATGHCAVWVDATVSGGFLTDPKQSVVYDKLGYAPVPFAKTTTGNHYLWSWAFAVPKSSQHVAEAQKFIYWATSRDYIKLVGETNGWGSVPPGTRTSTYDNPAYLKAAPFAKYTIEAMQTADGTHPSVLPVPYQGISFVRIPEFQGVGTEVGQQIAAAVAGQKTVDEALQSAQAIAEHSMREAGYIKE